MLKIFGRIFLNSLRFNYSTQMQLVQYLFAKEQIKQCTVVPDDQKILNLESPAFIALRPEAPIEKQVLDLPNHLPRTQIKSLVAYLTDVVKHWWGTIQQC